MARHAGLPSPMRRAWAACAAAAALVGALAVRPLAAQLVDPARSRAPVTAKDSLRLLQAMRTAQARFEGARRELLPLETGLGSRCERQTGRFCYWYDDEPKPSGLVDAEPVRAGRSRLLARLDSAARRLPGDPWVLQQRVRYALDAGDTARALGTLDRCGVERWRCAALAGLVHHVAARYREADSAFGVALGAMPRAQRCDWENIALLLEGDAKRRYDDARCEDRASLAARFWWLARPLLVSPANDLHTEWLARRTMLLVLRDAATTHGSSWGRDDEELLLRFGWSTWWSRYPKRSLGATPASSIIGHSRTPDFDFLSDERLLLDPNAVAVPGDWELQRRVGGFRYAPAYANDFASPAHQVATFQRGDSALVVAAWSLSADPMNHPAPLRATLALQPEPDSALEVVRDSAPRRAGTLVLRTRRRRGILSLEAVDSAATRAARLRSGVSIPPRTGALQLSDVLLYRADVPVDPTLESVLRHALTTDTIAGGRTGVFWETYGLRPGGEALAVGLTLERVGTPLIQRAAEALGLADRATPLQVRWPEQPDARTGIAARALTVDLSALAPGRYRLRLVTESAAARATSERELVIGARGTAVKK